MYKLGQRENLKIDKINTEVLLKKDNENNFVRMNVDELSGEKVGDVIDVFIYNDNKKLMATKKQPKIELGKIARLEVKDITRIGAFLDCGLDKDILLPFKEQTSKLVKGQKYLVYLYIDKSNRLALTMRIKNLLKNDSGYVKNDWVEGVIYNIVDVLGAFVAVDNKYEGLIPASELTGVVDLGEEVKCRVTDVKSDGKLDLSFFEPAYKHISSDADVIMEELKNSDGFINFNDKTPKLFPKIINAIIYKIVSIIITKIPVGICGTKAFKLIAIPEIPPIVKLKGIIKKKKPKVSINVPNVNIIIFLIILFMLSPPILLLYL